MARRPHRPIPGQPDLFREGQPRGHQFDIMQGRSQRDLGMAAAVRGSGAWFDQALRCILNQPRGWIGIGEDLRPVIEWQIGPPPKSTNIYGRLVWRAIELGVLKPTGRRRQMRLTTSHARMTDEYYR